MTPVTSCLCLAFRLTSLTLCHLPMKIHVKHCVIANEDIRETFQNFVHCLRLTEDTARNLENSTRGQGINPNWKEVHWHILTASHMGNVKHQKKVLGGHVNTIMYPANILCVKSLTYGNKKEAKARRNYACWHIQKCGAVTVKERSINSTLPMNDSDSNLITELISGCFYQCFFHSDIVLKHA